MNILLSQGQITPTHWAAGNDRVEALKLLVAHGAIVNMKDVVSAASVVYY